MPVKTLTRRARAWNGGQNAVLYERLEPRRLLSTFDIDGVQPVALDQPQIHALFRRTASGTPLTATDPIAGSTFDVQAFLDTGTSGMLLSQETAQGLGILSSTYQSQKATYSDVGVGGTENFDVSEPLYTALSWFPGTDYDNPATYQTVYNQKFGPIRTEINRAPADDLVGPLDILGMPVLQGKVMVMDPKPLEQLDYIHTFIYNPGTPYTPATRSTNPGIPTVNRHVKLSYGDFSRFTVVTPSGAPGPTLASNPFIGPDPTSTLGAASPSATPAASGLPSPPPRIGVTPPARDSTPPVQMQEGTKTSTGSFLFDTGAAASFISVAEAAKLGIFYKAGTYNTANADLVDSTGKNVAKQFQIPLGGVGGSIDAAGFYMDSLTLPTVEGQGIRFLHAPVLVADVSVQDPVTKQTLTLDGDFGMNFLVVSADISTGFPTNITAGAFDWVTFDQPNGLLGLDIPGATAPAPAAVTSSASTAAVSSDTAASTSAPDATDPSNRHRRHNDWADQTTLRSIRVRPPQANSPLLIRDRRKQLWFDV